MKILQPNYRIRTLKKLKKAADNLLVRNKEIIWNGIFSCRTPAQVESSIAFAHYLASVGITHRNYRLFLKMLETNNRWVVSALIGDRVPRLLFSGIRPNKLLISMAFQIIASMHPKEIHQKVLEAVFGILEYSYFKPDDGYKIRRLTITDLNNIGKFLDESSGQEEPRNRLILNVLDKITQLGEYQGSQKKSILAKQAFHIKIAFMDNTKQLDQIIPQLLLVAESGSTMEIDPEEDCIKLLKTRYPSISK